MALVTITRQYGAGGSRVAELTAQSLGWTVIDNEFIEEVALFVRKSGEQPSATEVQAVELAPKGQKPSGLVAETIELTGNVESIDAKKRTITVKGPAGNVRTFKVDKAVKNFNKIKNGAIRPF